MREGYRSISNGTAVRIINQRVGCSLSPSDIMWAEIDDSTKTIQFEDHMEIVWNVDVTGKKRRRWVWSDEWSDWEDKE